MPRAEARQVGRGRQGRAFAAELRARQRPARCGPLIEQAPFPQLMEHALGDELGRAPPIVTAWVAMPRRFRCVVSGDNRRRARRARPRQPKRPRRHNPRRWRCRRHSSQTKSSHGSRGPPARWHRRAVWPGRRCWWPGVTPLAPRTLLRESRGADPGPLVIAVATAGAHRSAASLQTGNTQSRRSVRTLAVQPARLCPASARAPQRSPLPVASRSPRAAPPV